MCGDSFGDYPNVAEFVEDSSGSFVDKLHHVNAGGLEHLDEVLSVVDMDHERYREWLDGEYRTVRPELDLLYLLRSEFDGVETNESPSGTRKDFDLYFETDGVPIWVEVKAPDILDKVGGWFSTKAPVDHIWNNIRSEKFKEINELTSNDSVVIIGVWLEIPHVQEMLLSKEFNKAAPNWASHIDGMITFTSLGVLSFDVAYTPISASGWDVMDIFDKL